MENDDLGNRMKEFYEERAKTYLTRRTPVIIRADGKSFHTFCKRFEKPFDHDLNRMLNNTMKYLCENIQGCKFGERHSDEISLLVTDYDTLTTDAFFNYGVQKVCSVVASLATSKFCQELIKDDNYLTLDEKWPTFDCRCFNIPQNEIANYFHWRQLDAKRNSISMFAQDMFSSKQLYKKTCNQMQEMMFQETGMNWSNLPQEQKTGYICTKETYEGEVNVGPNKGTIYTRNRWVVKPSTSVHADLIATINKSLGV
jgi:tRNA(His) 5'-end guanylyltransferase